MTGTPVEIPSWLVIASPWIVAAIGAAALIIVRKVRGPVTIQDLWAENRTLRKDVTTLQAQVSGLIRASTTQLSVNRVMGEGFDALHSAVDRSEVHITYTRAERDAIARARALRDDDDLWNTLQRAMVPDVPEPTEESET